MGKIYTLEAVTPWQLLVYESSRLIAAFKDNYRKVHETRYPDKQRIVLMNPLEILLDDISGKPPLAVRARMITLYYDPFMNVVRRKDDEEIFMPSRLKYPRDLFDNLI